MTGTPTMNCANQGRYRAGPQVLALAGVAALLLLSPSSARAVPVMADVVGCVGTSCTVEPIGGPVDVDPLGFTLEVEWGPEAIELLPDPPGGHWTVDLVFQFTGVHTGTEHWGVMTLLDHAGNPLALNEQFDDLNPCCNSPIRANYEVFHDNPADVGNSFFVRGLTIGLSDGSGVTTMQFVRAVFEPAAISAVPEPTTLTLLGAALAAAAWKRRRRD